MRTILIINEDHSLFMEQKEILSKIHNIIDFVNRDGWTYEFIKERLNLYKTMDIDKIIFASPIPAMIKLAIIEKFIVEIFHNDNREKVELPNGKIISKISETGWRLV